MAAIAEELGAEGYGIYWFLLEHFGSVMDSGCTQVPTLIQSELKWAEICHCSTRRFRKFADRATELRLICAQPVTDMRLNCDRRVHNRLQIDIPKLLKFRDEYSKKSGHTPDSRTEREQRESRERKQETLPTTEQAACGNVGNSVENPNSGHDSKPVSGNGATQTPDTTRRKPVLPPEQYRAQHPPMNESMFSKLLDSKDLNHFQNEIPKPSKPPPGTPDYLLSCEELAQPRNGSSKPREVVQIPVHPATELERMTARLAEMADDSPEWQDLACEISKKKASIEMKTKELERKLR